MEMNCFICGSNGGGRPLERHHLLEGRNRQMSERYGLTVMLCADCHREGKHAAHRDAQTALMLHRYGEERWLEENDGTIEEFIKLFGKNYLEGEQ